MVQESVPPPVTYQSSPVSPPIDANKSCCDDCKEETDSNASEDPPAQATFLRSSAGRQLEALITLVPLTTPISDEIDAHALVDSGCTGSCIDSAFVKRYNLPTKRYPNPLKVYNADGTGNDGGLITEYVSATGRRQDWYQAAHRNST